MDNTQYRKNRHSCYSLEYHLVLVTKYRHPVITDDLKNRLIDITYSVIEKDWGCIISSVNTDKDHIHVLFEAKPQTQLSKLVNNYKTVSSRLLRKEFADFLKPYYWKPYFWSDSYFICTVSDRTHAMVKRYIRDQGR
ncbi:MAG: IS200/IS605 family transposase [Oribacterium sp.]|nr:IS200/IS605 family transposase [Oribacterium sp.]